VQLQRSWPDLQTRGIGLAAISYDPPATLQSFAEKRAIAFPLLSDPGSATIRRYEILNTEATGQAEGIPYPGTFVLDGRGVVVSRSFEERYQERASAASLVPPAAGAAQHVVRKADTRHVGLTTSASDPVAAPGTRLSLFVDVAPKPKMHVYAPGQQELIPISLSLEGDSSFKAHPIRYPKSETYFFAPLGETQLVYSRPFRIIQDVTLALTPALRERARSEGASLTISGTLRYQACDDKVCYMPESLPVSWTIGLRPLER
jgi:hypothetical protein